MNRDNALIVAGLVDRISKLEKTIFKLQEIMNKQSFKIVAVEEQDEKYTNKTYEVETVVELHSGDIATVVFTQDILQFYIDTLNLELVDLLQELDEI